MHRSSFGLLGSRRISKCSYCAASVRTREPVRLRFWSRVAVVLLTIPVSVAVAYAVSFKIPDLMLVPGGSTVTTLGERLSSIDPSLPFAVVAPLSLLVIFAVDTIASRVLFRWTRLVRV